MSIKYDREPKTFERVKAYPYGTSIGKTCETNKIMEYFHKRGKTIIKK